MLAKVAVGGKKSLPFVSSNPVSLTAVAAKESGGNDDSEELLLMALALAAAIAEALPSTGGAGR